jgi:hypothetical protein
LEPGWTLQRPIGVKSLIFVLALLLAACSGSSDRSSQRPAGTSVPPTTRQGTASAGSQPIARPVANNAAVRSTAGIYAAVIRQLVTTDNPTASYRVIYVLDGVVPSAGYPSTLTDAKHRFDAALKTDLRAALTDLPPLTFIDRRSSVVAGTPPGQVIHGGVLLTLGPVRPHGAQVEVASNSWVNGLNGRWSTYVHNHAPDGWRVVGTTGPVAIS